MCVKFKFIVFLAIFLCLEETEAHVLKGLTVRNRPYAELKNGKIEGFAAELIEEIAAISGFNYTLEMTPDGRYGAVVNNTINGMLGEVHYNRADFAIADIAVTDIRAEYVDFTEPFIETNIVILINKNNVNNINSFMDLAEQTDIQYGAVLMGSTYYQLSQSTDQTLSKLYRQMTNNPDNLMMSLRDGVDKLNRTGYAFIVEKTFAEYITGIHCELSFIEDNNNYFTRQFAIALNKNSNYTEMFNTAIKRLKASGKIDALKSRYWKKCGVINGVTIVNPPYIELNDGKLNGFCVDLVKEISSLSGLDMKLGFTPDGQYGYVANGDVNGMVGEVYNNRADFAIADLTVTEARKQFVDFTEPFIETGLAILVHKSNANNINSFLDLADQTTIQYGIVKGGSTNKFFATSNDSTINKMHMQMQSNPNNYVTRLIEGVERVRAFPFALITETAFIKYIIGKDCDLTYIVDENNRFVRQYAIAVPKNSMYLDKLNSAIKKLKTDGLIDILMNRYWKNCGVLSGVTIRKWHLADLVFGKLEGFAVDLMNEISTISGFNYSLHFSPDNKYGIIENNHINGMLGEVYNYRADFAVADITITDVRKQFVDFTEPFIETGLVILIHKNYTNNITSFRDLRQQSLIMYGTLRNGSTYELFEHSSDPTLQEMYRQMSTNPEVFVTDTSVGIQKAKTTPFALILEKTSAELITGWNCDLTYIEDQNDYSPRQYGIALAKNSPHLEKFNSAIRQLRKSGRVDILIDRYRRKCGVLKGVTISNPPYAELLNGKISGFAVDLMNEIATINNNNYTLNFVVDGKYGRVENKRVMNGMIGEVYRKMADFAIADITVTDERRDFVDFTEPFIETGIAILIHRNNSNNITSFRDLLQQSDIKYGMVGYGTTYNHLAQSADSTIAQMFRVMSESPDVFTNSREGIERVNSTRFAFIVEQSLAEYITGKDCQLTYIEDPDIRFTRQYAIALPKNSTNLQEFNSAISQLKANGVIDTIRSKYWKKC